MTDYSNISLARGAPSLDIIAVDDLKAAAQAAFERDPLRIENLKLAGIDAIRITARRIERDPDQVAKRLRALLERRQQALRLDI